jgi:uncharacterized protein (DUF1684 family)
MGHAEEIEGWRVRRRARLQSPEGWLALVGLEWLEEGVSSIGSDPTNRVVLPPGRAPARLGSITVHGARARFVSVPEAMMTHDGRPVTTLDLLDDEAGDPTVLKLGSLSFHLISRQGRLAVRVRDSESRPIAEFRGLEYFPVDPRWRLQATFHPHDEPLSLFVPNVLGTGETMRSSGALEFEVGGSPHRLNTFLERGETELFIVFGDLTNGDETYGGGRYLYAPPPDARGRVELDFNKAYNPPCVFTSYATCTLPMPEDRLPLRIEAGEKRYPDPPGEP